MQHSHSNRLITWFDQLPIKPDIRRELARLTRFAVVGLSGTVIDIAVLALLTRGLGMPTLPANTLSYSVGVANNFILNRFWTFAESRTKPVTTQLIQFVAVNLVGLLLNDLIVFGVEAALLDIGGSLGSHATAAAKIAATGLVFFWNFAANRAWTYNDLNR